MSFISYDKRFDSLLQIKDDDELECVIRDSVIPKSIELNVKPVPEPKQKECFSPSNRFIKSDSQRDFSFSV